MGKVKGSPKWLQIILRGTWTYEPFHITPHGGVRWSPKSLGHILLVSWLSVQNFMVNHWIVVEIFPSPAKWLWPTLLFLEPYMAKKSSIYWILLEIYRCTRTIKRNNYFPCPHRSSGLNPIVLCASHTVIHICLSLPSVRLALSRTRLLTRAAKGFMCRSHSKSGDSSGESDNENKDYIPLVGSRSISCQCSCQPAFLLMDTNLNWL